jgi:PAS domain S-box-containing protein
MSKKHRVHVKSGNPAKAPTKRALKINTVLGTPVDWPAADQTLETISSDSNSADAYQNGYGLAPIGSLILDRQGRICELNDKAAQLLSFSPKWVVGKSFVVFVAKHDVTRFLAFLRSCTEGKWKTMEFDLHIPDRTVPVQVAAAVWKEGADMVHRLSIIDLTDFRNTVVYNAPDTIMTVDARGWICFVNRPSWGHSVNALIGTNLLNHVAKSNRPTVLRCLVQSFRFNKRSACELTGVCGDWNNWFSFSFGPPHPFAPVGPHRSAKTARTTTTTTTTTTVTIREISNQKRTEEMLRTSSDQMRDFAARLESVREEERAQVAREIHDELGQALTGLKLDLSWLYKNSTNGNRKKMKAMIAQVDETIDRVRTISWQLRPPILDDVGLIAAIDWQMRDFRKRTGIKTEVVSNVDELDLSAEASAAIFRVVQEALTNVTRHAKASRTRVTVDLTARSLRIAVEDNGQGMTQNQEAALKSLGILGMKERIYRIGGALQIHSGPGKGTRLDILIPTHHD